MPAFEVNFDGLVGPTHNYAGLSSGNLASQRHRNTVSNPREAALQGLDKMKFLAALGPKQGVLPPQERPDLRTLRRLGFTGTDTQVVDRARREAPLLLAACYSASGMWAANAATVAPSADSADHRVHFTPANLVSQFHRSLEAQTTGAMLRAIFPDERLFAHHEPLPSGIHFGDEGAANHTRLAPSCDTAGLELFVYGRQAFAENARLPAKFPARQTREASEAIARLHQLDHERTLFLQQNPAAIDAGAFHNDVVAVGNLNVLLCHEAAFADGRAALDQIKSSYQKLSGSDLVVIEVTEEQVPLADAVQSYLFNSQILQLPDQTMSVIAPIECREMRSSWIFLEHLMGKRTPIKSVHFIDVRQSMKNGGGPACLRLRVVLTEEEIRSVHQPVLMSDALYMQLSGWITRRYRQKLSPDDLADPQLITESRDALDELTQMLKLGPVYDFQK